MANFGHSSSDMQRFFEELSDALQHCLRAPLLRETMFGTVPGQVEPRTAEEAGSRILDRLQQATAAVHKIFEDVKHLNSYQFQFPELMAVQRDGCDLLVAMHNAIVADNKMVVFPILIPNAPSFALNAIAEESFENWNTAHQAHNTFVLTVHQLREAQPSLLSGFHWDDFMIREMLRKFSDGRDFATNSSGSPASGGRSQTAQRPIPSPSSGASTSKAKPWWKLW